MYLTTCLQEARRFHSLTAVGGVLVAAGGRNNSRRLLKSVELLGPGDTAWTTADWSLQEEVSEHCAVALSDEELVILGGWTNRKADFEILLLTNDAFLNQFIFYRENKVSSYYIQRF